MKRIATVVLACVAAALPTMIPAEAVGSCRTHTCWHRVHMNRAEHSVEKKIARITPYRCGTVRGSIRSAVPCSIITHESAMVRVGAWQALNTGSSGTPCATRACGPYQFLGWPVPWPVIVKSHYDTLKRMLAHHRMARQLWAQQTAGAACHWCY